MVRRLIVVACLLGYLTGTLRAAAACASVGSASLDGCPIPLSVSLAYQRTEPATSSQPARNIYRVKWQISGMLPPGITRVFSFEVWVRDVGGVATATHHGATFSCLIEVAQTSAIPNLNLTPLARVNGIAYSVPCNTELTYTASGTNSSVLVGCSVPLQFSSPPEVQTVFKTLSNGARAPDGFGIRVEWATAGALANCVVVKGFSLKVIVNFADGSRQTFSESIGPNVRNKTIKVSNSPLAANRPTIAEVKLNAVTEVKLFGQG